MALVVADRVQETSTTIGTGTLSLGGAATGYQSFVSGIGNGNSTYYTIQDPVANVWEVGIGTVTSGSPNTLSRTTVLSNSSGNTSPISLVGNTVNVWCDYPAEKMASRDSLYAPSTFQGTFSDGIVVDYTTGLGRISVGTADAVKFYNGGVGTTLLGGFSATTGVTFPDSTTQLSAGATKAQAIAYAMTLGF